MGACAARGAPPPVLEGQAAGGAGAPAEAEEEEEEEVVEDGDGGYATEIFQNIVL